MIKITFYRPKIFTRKYWRERKQLRQQGFSMKKRSVCIILLQSSSFHVFVVFANVLSMSTKMAEPGRDGQIGAKSLTG